MNKKIITLLIALTLTTVAFMYSRQTGIFRSDVKGASIATNSFQETGIAENRAERIPQQKTNIDSLLVSLGKSAGLSIIEINDSSYLWKTDTNTYEVLGKNVSIEGATQEVMGAVKNALQTQQFSENSLNTYILDNKEHTGFSNDETVCVLRKQEIEDPDATVKTFTTRFEIRCGVIDYSRVINTPSSAE